MEIFRELQYNLSTSSLGLTEKSISFGTAYYLLTVVLPYCILTSIILGLFGFLGNALTFLQPEFRGNICCIYTLSSSIVDVLHLLINVFPDFLKTKYGISGMWNVNDATCKLYYFLYSFLPQLAINLLVLTIFDRFACTCPLGSGIHRINQKKMIPKMICSAIVISGLLSLYGPILGYLGPIFCAYREGKVYGMLNICINGIMQPVLMLVFTLLTYRNVLKSRQRVDSVMVSNSNRFRNQFIAMVITQVVATAVFSLQWMICQTYVLFNGDSFQLYENFLYMEMFVSFTNTIYTLNNVKSFYFSLLTSKIYRQIFVKGLNRLLARHSRR